MRPLSLLLCLLILSTLAGCISYEEEIWIAEDGTGRLHSTIVFSEKVTQLMRDTAGGLPTPEEIKKRSAQSEGVELDTVWAYEEDGKMHLAIEMRFAKFSALKKLQGQGQQNNANLFGDAQISRTDAGALEFRRSVQIGKGSDHSSSDIFSRQLIRALLAGDAWKYTVHFPTAVAASNAPDWNAKTRTLSWQFDLVDLSEEPGIMRATLTSSHLDQALLQLFSHTP